MNNKPGRHGTHIDVGVPDAWSLWRYLRCGGVFLVRDFRRCEPTVINSIMAMYSELYRRNRKRFYDPYGVYSIVREAIGWPRKVRRAMQQYASTSRRVHGRSYVGQAIDMTRAFHVCALNPHEYYSGQLARHLGGPEVRNYIPWSVFTKIMIELQRDTFGAPPFKLNDKAAFCDWCRSGGIRSPREIALDANSPEPPPDVISQLGKSLFVKPRSDMGGNKAEEWNLDTDGLWHCREQSPGVKELAVHFSRRAKTDSNGLVVQERLRNHHRLSSICGSALSTSRIITVLNEEDEPEIVHGFWRMATDSDSVVDNFHSGGTAWISNEFETGNIALGVDQGSMTRQDIQLRHPVSGEEIAGTHHPFWKEIRDFALDAHRKLDGVVLVGWDIAMTPDGPAAVESNFPPGYNPVDQMVWDGFENCRLGEILAWRARRWIERNVDKSSRRYISAD